jgi:predicted ribosomally synthesized peptide with SipW-like signal peptide
MKIRMNQKVVALAAAGLVLLSGATVTSLAAWTDTEWVNGGVATLPGVTASKFDVEQNVTTSAGSNWTTNLSAPGGTVDFGAQAADLTPGTTVYGFVRLRTVIGSIGGTLQLVHGPSTGSLAFLAALTYGAWLVSNPAACNSTQYDTGTAVQLVTDNSAIATDSPAPSAFPVAAGTATLPGAEQTVCFKLNFPASASSALEGASADPVWQFNATSN